MAASLVGGAAVGAVFGELLKVVLEIRGKAGMFKQTLASLRSTLVAITPTIKEIEQHYNDLGRPKEELEWLIKEMEKGTKLVRKCSKIHRLNYVARVRYQYRLEEFIDSLMRFFTINMQAYTSRDQKETLLELRKIRSLINKLPLVNPEYTAGSSSDSITVSESNIYDENAMETNCTEEAMENINQLTRNSSWDSDYVYFSAYEDEPDIPHSPTQSAENVAGTNSTEQALVPPTNIAHETYDRSCIEKWMQSGYLTCLKTQQTLTSTAVIPNYVLRSIVEQWCEANGIEPPIRASSSQPSSSSGAIPPLVTLLSEGTQRGKKDAVAALFNLCIYQDNRGKAVSAGVIPTLMRLLTEPSWGMVDEALIILTILSSHPEGKIVIGAEKEAVPTLVEFICNGSQKNKENATAVLVNLCSGGDQQYLARAQELGVMGPLLELAQYGTDRGKKKAAQLIGVWACSFSSNNNMRRRKPKHKLNFKLRTRISKHL